MEKIKNYKSNLLNEEKKLFKRKLNRRIRLKSNDEETIKKDLAWNALRRLSKGGERIYRHGLGKIRVKGHLNYREIIHRFERQSTFHGISHAALAPNTKWRIIWYTAFTICVCALLLQIILLIRRYRTYAKNVDLDLKFENAPFPSVTLCNLNPYKASAILREESTRAAMDAFSNIVEDGGTSYGISAAIEAARNRQSRRKRKLTQLQIRRYHQVYAKCLCEVNSITGQRSKGSCFAMYKGNVSILFAENLHLYYPTRCICQLDWVSKTLWPCFPHNTWRKQLCAQCSGDLGHCPMLFINDDNKADNIARNPCLCHEEYNHCIAKNYYGYIMEIDASDGDLTKLNIKPTETIISTTTTTQAPEIKKAYGFEGLKDEIAIKSQAKENLLFAVGELANRRKISMSHTKEEFILKCSFNQRDCDIKSDFALHYDQTFGNCFTFNWNRTKQVTAHRAGANYGLKILLYADVEEYLPTSDMVGFRITVHDKWTVPFPDAFGHNAPTGFLSSFGVRMKQFKRIPPPHGQCFNEDEIQEDEFLYENFKYSVEGCHRSCTQKEIISACGCGDPTYPVPENTKTCKANDPISRECIKNISLVLGQLFAEGSLPNCKCHQPCFETNYEITYSAARWPSGTSKLMECEIHDDLCMEKYRKNAAMIQIFYEELNYETMTETPAYTLTSALADLGGLTGLWIGASVVSLLEIAALIVYTVQAYVRKKRSKISNQSNLMNQPIVIYPKYSKHSLQQANSMHLWEKSVDGSTISLKSKRSLLDNPNLEIIVDESEKEDEHSSLEEEAYPYLPPNSELPCDCIYNEKGQLKIMNALCPEHGYLVRRGANYFVYFDSDEDKSQDSAKSSKASMNLLRKITEARLAKNADGRKISVLSKFAKKNSGTPTKKISSQETLENLPEHSSIL